MPLHKAVLARYPGDAFVETGTFCGNGIATALACGFKQIRSVDLSREMAEFSIQRFREHGDRVKIWHGNSVQALPILLGETEGEIVCWLDAHSMNPAGISLEKLRQDVTQFFPLLAELELVLKEPRVKAVLVDDVRLLRSHSWWTVTLDAVLDRMSNWKLAYEDGAVEGDVLGFTK